MNQIVSYQNGQILISNTIQIGQNLKRSTCLVHLTFGSLRFVHYKLFLQSTRNYLEMLLPKQSQKYSSASHLFIISSTCYWYIFTCPAHLVPWRLESEKSYLGCGSLSLSLISDEANGSQFNIKSGWSFSIPSSRIVTATPLKNKDMVIPST